jgi:zinc transport system permease protein
MEELLSYTFMQRAFLAGVGVSVTCAILGVFLVLKKDAMIGHGLAHVTFGGVALGLVLYVAPLPVALGVAILAALGLLKLKERAGLYGDTAIGIISSLGMALGIFLVSVAGSFNLDLFGYLFGSVLAIDPGEVWVAFLLALVVLITVAFFYQDFFFLTFDPESARCRGPGEAARPLLAVLTAVTVVLGMKVVGLLLISALLIIPAAAALQIAGFQTGPGNFRRPGGNLHRFRTPGLFLRLAAFGDDCAGLRNLFLLLLRPARGAKKAFPGLQPYHPGSPGPVTPGIPD